MRCKWLSDDFSEICVNGDCPYCAGFCPLTEHPEVCRYYEQGELPTFEKVVNALRESPFFSRPVKGRLYAVEYKDGKVKIGYTTNATERFHRLQYYYRGRFSPIVKTYIGKSVDDCKVAEKIVVSGLRAVEKRELFDITFNEAVRRIMAVVPDDDPFITWDRMESIKEFPSLLSLVYFDEITEV